MIPLEPENSNPSDDPIDDFDVAEAVFDVLLTEALTGQSPPDQSDIILRRLQQPIVCIAATARTSGNTSAQRRKSGSIQRLVFWKVAIVTAAALLLCIGVVVGMRHRSDSTIAINAGSRNGLEGAKKFDGDARPGQTADGVNNGQPVLQDRLSAPPIALDDATAGSDLPTRDPSKMFNEPDSQLQVPLIPTRKPVSLPLTLVSTSLADHLNHYWDRVGVKPAKQLPPEVTAQRLSDRLRVQITPEAIGESQVMLSLLMQKENAKLLAGPVLAAISSRPNVSLTRPVDQQMMREVAKQLLEGRGFDRLVASWFVKVNAAPENVGDQSAPAVVSMGSLLSPLTQHEAVVSTGSLVLGNDMRCARCHDLPASGGNAVGSQHEYWQFAASLAPWLEQKPNGPSGWFYDTLDGRRRLAETRDSFDLSQHLVGSRPLASGLVDAMWKMVHGRPLTSTPYDLSGSADDSDLQQLRHDLADDLIANDFNLSRTISLIMTDPVVGRSTPDAMTPSGLLTASADEWIGAVMAVESFAAAPPASLPSSRIDRMNLVLSELPNTGSIDSASKLLAQPLISQDLGSSVLPGPQKFLPTEMPKPSPATVAGLPVRATIVMPAWMDKLPGFDNRLEHIANLAGLSEVPEEVQVLATQMRVAGLDETLTLQRIWWIIRPQE